MQAPVSLLEPCPRHPSKLARVQALISRTETRDCHLTQKPFTAYVITVKGCCGTCVVYKRYSEFVELHNQLMKDYYKLPKLPPKKLFGSSMEVDFITARQRELELYIQALLKEPQLLSSPALIKFLQGERRQRAGSLGIDHLTQQLNDMKLRFVQVVRRMATMEKDIKKIEAVAKAGMLSAAATAAAAPGNNTGSAATGGNGLPISNDQLAQLVKDVQFLRRRVSYMEQLGLDPEGRRSVRSSSVRDAVTGDGGGGHDRTGRGGDSRIRRGTGMHPRSFSSMAALNSGLPPSRLGEPDGQGPNDVDNPATDTAMFEQHEGDAGDGDDLPIVADRNVFNREYRTYSERIVNVKNAAAKKDGILHDDRSYSETTVTQLRALRDHLTSTAQTPSPVTSEDRLRRERIERISGNMACFLGLVGNDGKATTTKGSSPSGGAGSKEKGERDATAARALVLAELDMDPELMKTRGKQSNSNSESNSVTSREGSVDLLGQTGGGVLHRGRRAVSQGRMAGKNGQAGASRLSWIIRQRRRFLRGRRLQVLRNEAYLANESLKKHSAQEKLAQAGTAADKTEPGKVEGEPATSVTAADADGVADQSHGEQSAAATAAADSTPAGEPTAATQEDGGVDDGAKDNNSGDGDAADNVDGSEGADDAAEAGLPVADAVKSSTGKNEKKKKKKKKKSKAVAVPPPSWELAVLDQTLLSCVADRALSDKVHELVRYVAPSDSSEQHFGATFTFIENLVKGCVGGGVFAHGSFGLKTYLPDADMDVSAFFSQAQAGGSWVKDTVAALCQKAGSRSQDPNFQVRSATFVNAECKVVKCQIGRIPVDITGNQVGALSTLALFEEIDRLVGKNHLFKRTLLLTKAWAKNEARILEAGQGQMSSYCLRSVVAYIFNAYHAQINTPLQGLYRLFTYLESFDWDNFALGLYGPIQLAELPKFEPATGPCAWPAGTVPLISTQLLSSYSLANVVPPGNIGAGNDGSSAGAANDGSNNNGANKRVLYRKYLNVIDPINPYNNLGRSVNRINAQLIRDHFVDAAARMREVLVGWAQLRAKCAEGLSNRSRGNSHSEGSSDNSRSKNNNNNNNNSNSDDSNDSNNAEGNSTPQQNESAGDEDGGQLTNNSGEATPATVPARYTEIEQQEAHNIISELFKYTLRAYQGRMHWPKPRALNIPGGDGAGDTDDEEEKSQKGLRLVDAPTEPDYHLLDGKLSAILCDLQRAREFETPCYFEQELVHLIRQILEEQGPVPVGKMGSLLHSKTNNHQLPATLKERYGGLKKFLARHEVFEIGTDHPFNPHVSLVGSNTLPRSASKSKKGGDGTGKRRKARKRGQSRDNRGGDGNSSHQQQQHQSPQQTTLDHSQQQQRRASPRGSPSRRPRGLGGGSSNMGGHSNSTHRGQHPQQQQQQQQQQLSIGSSLDMRVKPSHNTWGRTRSSLGPTSGGRWGQRPINARHANVLNGFDFNSNPGDDRPYRGARDHKNPGGGGGGQRTSRAISMPRGYTSWASDSVWAAPRQQASSGWDVRSQQQQQQQASPHDAWRSNWGKSGSS